MWVSIDRIPDAMKDGRMVIVREVIARIVVQEGEALFMAGWRTIDSGHLLNPTHYLADD